MRYRAVLLFGAPGAGKGTQGKILGTIPGFFHCACGDVFRNLKPDAPVTKRVNEYTHRGDLVPDELTLQIWTEFIQASIEAGRFHPERDTLILDGIPRNVNQVKLMKEAVRVVGIFYLRCPRVQVLIKRLQGRGLKENRKDDASIEIIRNRLETYERDSKPVLRCYSSNLLHRINADQPPARVLVDILKRLITK